MRFEISFFGPVTGAQERAMNDIGSSLLQVRGWTGCATASNAITAHCVLARQRTVCRLRIKGHCLWRREGTQHSKLNRGPTWTRSRPADSESRHPCSDPSSVLCENGANAGIYMRWKRLTCSTSLTAGASHSFHADGALQAWEMASTIVNGRSEIRTLDSVRRSPALRSCSERYWRRRR